MKRIVLFTKYGSVNLLKNYYLDEVVALDDGIEIAARLKKAVKAIPHRAVIAEHRIGNAGILRHKGIGDQHILL